MQESYQIRSSSKKGINSEISGIVTRGDTVYLRIVGDRSRVAVMTATVGEDDGSFLKCTDQTRLMTAAVLFREKYGATPDSGMDLNRLDFERLAYATENEDISQIANEFFEIFYQCSPTETVQPAPKAVILQAVKRHSTPQTPDELYETLAIDDSGEDVYLGDGLWISPNGSVKDLGR